MRFIHFGFKRFFGSLALGLSLIGCGGGGAAEKPTTVIASNVGGNLTGLAAGQKVSLLNNGAGALTLTANGAFTFPAAIPQGGAYAVTVDTPPLNQSCVVANGSGSADSSAVPSVTVTCTTYPNCASVSPETCSLFHGMTAGINVTSLYTTATYDQMRVSDALITDLCHRFDTFRLMLYFFNASGAVNEPLIAASKKTAEKFLACGATVIVTQTGLPTAAGWTDANPPEAQLNQLWTQIGRAYQGTSNKVLFELLNEPRLNSDSNRLNAAMHGMLAALRATGLQNTVILSPAGASEVGFLAGVKFPADTNIIYTVHQYEPFSFTHQGRWWSWAVNPSGVTCCDAAQTNTIDSRLRIAYNWTVKTGYPIIITEFGSIFCGDRNSRKNFMTENLSRARQWDMPAVLWSYDDAFGIFEKRNSTWDPLLLPLIQKASAGAPPPGFTSYLGNTSCK